ncbi:unnamed protein product [Caretta caretta]
MNSQSSASLSSPMASVCLGESATAVSQRKWTILGNACPSDYSTGTPTAVPVEPQDIFHLKKSPLWSLPTGWADFQALYPLGQKKILETQKVNRHDLDEGEDSSIIED